MIYKLEISYDGTNYHGYQKQNDLKTIELVLDNTLKIITKKDIKTISSGRTDKGVHALGQVVSFEYSGNMQEINFYKALNSLLPEDIHVISVKKVNDDFHARYSAKKKEYRYFLSLKEPNIFYRNLCLYDKNLDIKLMKKAIKKFIGEHDFRGFSKSDIEKNTIKRIYEAKIILKDDLICFKFVGNGFLKYMVRCMVGTLIQIGKHKKDINIIDEIFMNQKRNLAGKTIDAKGLYLWKVYY